MEYEKRRNYKITYTLTVVYNMLQRSGRTVEKRKIRLLECMKYIIILLYTSRFKDIKVRERFVYEEFIKAIQAPQRSPKFSTEGGMKIILQQG